MLKIGLVIRDGAEAVREIYTFDSLDEQSQEAFRDMLSMDYGYSAEQIRSICGAVEFDNFGDVVILDGDSQSVNNMFETLAGVQA